MKNYIHTRFASFILVLVFPLMVGCSALSGSGYSNDPVVAAQERKIETLKAEAERAEREVEDAEQRLRAAKSRLKAAEEELKVLENEAKRRTT